jgi:hypothetical protein
MDTLDKVLEQWESDSKIDQTEPSKELIRTPLLHSKYLKALLKHKMSAKKADSELLRMKKLKWEYYSGKMSQEDLDKNGWEPFGFKLKSDIPTYLESDDDMIRLQEKKFYHDEIVKAIEYIIAELKQRTWQLRSYIDWERFIGGQ